MKMMISPILLLFATTYSAVVEGNWDFDESLADSIHSNDFGIVSGGPETYTLDSGNHYLRINLDTCYKADNIVQYDLLRDADFEFVIYHAAAFSAAVSDVLAFGSDTYIKINSTGLWAHAGTRNCLLAFDTSPAELSVTIGLRGTPGNILMAVGFNFAQCNGASYWVTTTGDDLAVGRCTGSNNTDVFAIRALELDVIGSGPTLSPSPSTSPSPTLTLTPTLSPSPSLTPTTSPTPTLTKTPTLTLTLSPTLTSSAVLATPPNSSGSLTLVVVIPLVVFGVILVTVYFCAIRSKEDI